MLMQDIKRNFHGMKQAVTYYELDDMIGSHTTDISGIIDQICPTYDTLYQIKTTCTMAYF